MPSPSPAAPEPPRPRAGLWLTGAAAVALAVQAIFVFVPEPKSAGATDAAADGTDATTEAAADSTAFLAGRRRDGATRPIRFRFSGGRAGRPGGGFGPRAG